MFYCFQLISYKQNFDSLRALKKEVAKYDQSEKGKAKTKEISFPIDAASYYVFSAKQGKV